MTKPSAADRQPFNHTQDACSALLRRIGLVEGLDVLVIGSGALDIMCGLDERGARSVTAVRAGRRPPTEPVDLVVVLRLDSPELAGLVAAQARLALARAAGSCCAPRQAPRDGWRARWRCACSTSASSAAAIRCMALS